MFNKVIAFGFALLLLSCNQNNGRPLEDNIQGITSNLSSAASSFSEIKLSMNCFQYSTSNLLNTEEGRYWKSRFAALFPQIVSSPDYVSLWSAERSCQADEDKRLVTFVYRPRIHSYLHTIVALFDRDKKLVKYADIPCDYIDDLGGVDLKKEVDNHLFVLCQTGGIAPEGQQSISELISINLADFTFQSIIKTIR